LTDTIFSIAIIIEKQTELLTNNVTN